MGVNESKVDKNLEQAPELTEEQTEFLLKNTGFNREEIIKWNTGFIVST